MYVSRQLAASISAMPRSTCGDRGNLDVIFSYQLYILRVFSVIVDSPIRAASITKPAAFHTWSIGGLRRIGPTARSTEKESPGLNKNPNRCGERQVLLRLVLPAGVVVVLSAVKM
ncbi:hypothetical protein ACQKWADRAFT_287065 [Trichoderma austrokoningii]